MSAADLLALADRCEREEPSRELDARIAREMGEAANYEGDGVYGCRNFTTSLDAAVGLVPEFWRWSVETGDRCRAVVHNKTALFLGDRHIRHGASHLPALALCAATLRARAAKGQGE